MTPHTPGPWLLTRDKDTSFWVGKPYFAEQIAHVNVLSNPANGEGNALLIASAPDMFEAAKEVMSALEEHGPSIVPHLVDTDENAGQRLREAIAKAEGKK